MKTRYRRGEDREYTIEEYLNICKYDPSAYASPAERMLLAIGEPETLNTALDPRLSRIFMNKIIRRYPAFKEFYGVEEIVEKIVGYLKHSAQGLEERKQILYLLGPVGGGKSSFAEKLKSLIEQVPFYAIKNSPINENPLGLFTAEDDGEWLEEDYGIPRRYLNTIMSPWAVKRLAEFDGDINKFKVVKMYPSMLHRRAVVKTEPGDENNQDISSLVGKVDIRKLEEFSQDDPDAYNFSGGLCFGNRGMLEFVEMFKAPIKVLNPLLTATQEGNYNGTENGGAIPFEGIIVAHSNESEWEQFKGNQKNEAFLDRVYVVKVPYCLRVSEEAKIYKKLLRTSALAQSPCAPNTLEMLSQFIVLSRLMEPENSNIFSKLRVYDGENLKDTDPKAKSLQEYKSVVGINEGMKGLSTRFAFKILSKVFNYDQTEVGANPIHLMAVLDQELPQECQGDLLKKYQTYIKEFLFLRYKAFIGKEIQSAYIESYGDYGQNIFDRYITYADFWIQDQEYRDGETGTMLDRKALNEELEKIEKPAGIANPKDFRNEVVSYVLRYRSKKESHGENPPWTSYEKLRAVIERKMFSNTEELIPAIAFDAKRSEKDQKAHAGFVARMMEKGYTEKMTRIACEFYIRTAKSA
ncbi:MAG: PrkA family serine protein kinase [Candidatus Parcubacteria bacterium]|nr:PrkA family serine protein kinase [Candidatus Parcubacteria bacterium]